MSAPRIICLGEPLVEFVRQDDGQSYLRGFGGDTSNAAIAAARQGASVGYVTMLGADRFGDAVMEMWAGEGIDTSGVLRDREAPTGIYFVDPDPEERHFTYYRNGSAASLLTPAQLPQTYFAEAEILYLSGITLAVSPDLRASALAAMEIVGAAGGCVSLDTNLRLALWSAPKAREVIESACPRIGVLVTSLDDSAHLTGLSDPDAIIAHYQALGPGIVLVTMGADGCRIGVGAERQSIAPVPANPIDSTGAGDSFAGAYLAWWLEIGDPFEAARRAAIVAAGTVSGLGAVAPIPHRAEVLAHLGRA